MKAHFPSSPRIETEPSSGELLEVNSWVSSCDSAIGHLSLTKLPLTLECAGSGELKPRFLFQQIFRDLFQQPRWKIGVVSVWIGSGQFLQGTNRALGLPATEVEHNRFPELAHWLKVLRRLLHKTPGLLRILPLHLPMQIGAHERMQPVYPVPCLSPVSYTHLTLP